jgi:hypothetical protein
MSPESCYWRSRRALLLALAAGETQYRLTPAQLKDLELALEEADRGNFASEGEMAETWKKFGL